MKKLLITIITLSAFGVANAATSTLKNDGFYAGLNIGVASTPDMLNINDNLELSNGQQSLGDIGITAGYNFNKFFAAEVDYLLISTYSTTTTVNLPILGSYTATMDQNNSFLTLNAKGTLPLNEKFDLFGKVGAGANFASVSGSLWDTSINGNSTNLVVALGVGAAYHLNEKVSFNISDSYYINTAPTISNSNASSNNFSFGNVNSINLGMQYSF